MYPKLTGRTRYRTSLIFRRLILQVEYEYLSAGDPLGSGSRTVRAWRDAKVEDISEMSDLPDTEVVGA